MYVGYMSYMSYVNYNSCFYELLKNCIKTLEFVLSIVFFVFKVFQKIFVNT